MRQNWNCVRHDACSHKFSAPVELYVYPDRSSAKQNRRHVVFNITNDIKMGHASDCTSRWMPQGAGGLRRSGTGMASGTSGSPETDSAYLRLCFNEACSGS
jgi:hypothetical protein